MSPQKIDLWFGQKLRSALTQPCKLKILALAAGLGELALSTRIDGFVFHFNQLFE
jgi:hypothetical protein